MVSHGPCIVDNNPLSTVSLRNCSQGTAFLHNLLAGRVELERVLIRHTPYHLPHSTSVAGLMTVQGGDDRWLNNIFVGPIGGEIAVARGGLIDIGDVASGEATRTTGIPTGLSVYDGYPIPTDDWCIGLLVDEYMTHRYPSIIQGNIHAAGSRPFDRESNATVVPALGSGMVLSKDGSGVNPSMATETSWPALDCALVDAARLGTAFVPEVPFAGTDGRELRLDLGYSNRARGNPACTGPFELLRTNPSSFITTAHGASICFLAPTTTWIPQGGSPSWCRTTRTLIPRTRMPGGTPRRLPPRSKVRRGRSPR